MSGNDLAALWIGLGEDVLDEVVAELVTSNVNEWHTRALWARFAHAVEVAVEEVVATNLQTLLDNLGGELIHAVLGGEAENMVDRAGAVWNGAMLADVLDAPVAELAVGDDVNACKHFGDARALVFLKAVLEDILNDEAAGLTQSDFMPHTT